MNWDLTKYNCRKLKNIKYNTFKFITTNFDDLLINETFKIDYCDIIILSECHKIDPERNFNIIQC